MVLQANGDISTANFFQISLHKSSQKFPYVCNRRNLIWVANDDLKKIVLFYNNGLEYFLPSLNTIFNHILLCKPPESF